MQFKMSTEQLITSNHSLKENAVSFLLLVASGKAREAYQTYISSDFRHHNLYFRGNAESLMLEMEENAALYLNKILEVKLAIQEKNTKNTLVVHSHVRQNPEGLGGAVVHIFRFQDNQTVELWDIGQRIPEDSLMRTGCSNLVNGC